MKVVVVVVVVQDTVRRRYWLLLCERASKACPPAGRYLFMDLRQERTAEILVVINNDQ